jgi:hypothetical protein
MSSGQISSDFQRCVICQEAYVVGEEVSWSKILLDCNHAYHPACIKEWLMRNAGCPCCRASFIHPNDLKVHFCFGAKSAKAKWTERKNQIIGRRTQGEFCIEHGLIFPSEEEAGVFSDEEAGGGEEVGNSNDAHVPAEGICSGESQDMSVEACNSPSASMTQKEDQCVVIMEENNQNVPIVLH